MNTKSSIIKKVLYIIIPLTLVAVVVIKLKTNKGITESKVYQYDKQDVDFPKFRHSLSVQINI